MIEIISPIKPVRQVAGRIRTTVRLRVWLGTARIPCPENDLEVVALGGDKYLAYDRRGYEKRKQGNPRATTILSKAHPGPLKVFGVAVTWCALDTV